MGKDFIPTTTNRYSLKSVYNKLFSGTYEITQTDNEKFFNRIPLLSEITEIDLGSNGTNESIIWLKEGGFVVINKTIELS